MENLSYKIRLSNGEYTVVSSSDYDFLSALNWHQTNKGYARTSCRGECVYMHTLIARRKFGNKYTEDYCIDHVDGNPLNNQRSNIRLATYSQNSQNSAKTSSSKSSKFKGVSYVPDKGLWRANITIDGKLISLGYHLKEELAAKIYDLYALEYFGRFARLNFPLISALNQLSGDKLVKPVRGVYFFKKTSRWVARITINGKLTHLGYFATYEEAVDAVTAAKQV